MTYVLALAVVVVLLLTGVFFAVVLRGRRRARSAEAGTEAVLKPAREAVPELRREAVPEHGREAVPWAAPPPADDENDWERRERLLTTAFRAGSIPAVWYRHQMAALAAETADQEPRV